MNARRTTIMALCCVAILTVGAAGQVTASTPYTVSIFATSVPGVYFQPDSITAYGGHVFVGYGNNVATDGSDGKSSTIVEYDRNGIVLKTYSVVGHNDGLRINLKTKQLWAMQNEDGNPNLVIIDLASGTQAVYTFAPTSHGGGYDDIAFRGDEAYFSASNPLFNPNTKPAIVRGTISGSMVNVTPVLLGNAVATDIPTDTPVTLNLQDPDSMKFNAFGDLVLDSQADGELIIVHHVGAFDQSVYRLSLTLNGASTQIDDTNYADSSHGVLLVSDRDGETVYSISKDIFSPGAAYSATPTSVGSLDQDTGVITNVVTGMVYPHGMLFLNEHDE
jgi:hypothetical protein